MTESTTGKRVARHYLKRETAQARAYSQAVITEGGKTIWLAGQVGAADALGKSLAGDFDGQVREVFSRLGRTLEEAGERAGQVSIARAAPAGHSAPMPMPRSARKRNKNQ